MLKTLARCKHYNGNDRVPLTILGRADSSEVNAKDKHGMTALHWAAKKGFNNTCLAILLPHCLCGVELTSVVAGLQLEDVVFSYKVDAPGSGGLPVCMIDSRLTRPCINWLLETDSVATLLLSMMCTPMHPVSLLRAWLELHAWQQACGSALLKKPRALPRSMGVGPSWKA